MWQVWEPKEVEYSEIKGDIGGDDEGEAKGKGQMIRIFALLSQWWLIQGVMWSGVWKISFGCYTEDWMEGGGLRQGDHMKGESKQEPKLPIGGEEVLEKRPQTYEMLGR